jgi:hypothetical protein
MTMTLPPGEPAAGPWRPVPFHAFADLVLTAAGTPVGRPRIVAVDGRGASGKTTLAARLHRHVPNSAVVHTDDLAWHEPLFAWGHLLADGVLRPLHRGEAVSFIPPAWAQRGRDGAVEVPAGLDLVIIEGTGASQREHAALIDTTVWVQADFAEAERRGIARDIAEGVNGDPDQAAEFWRDWMSEELPFLARQQPWRRARVIVNGTPGEQEGDDVVIALALDPTQSR